MRFSYNGRSYTGCGDGDIYYNGSLVKRIFINGSQAYQRYSRSYHRDVRTCYRTESCTKSVTFCVRDRVVAVWRNNNTDSYGDIYGYDVCIYGETAITNSYGSAKSVSGSHWINCVDWEYSDEYSSSADVSYGIGACPGFSCRAFPNCKDYYYADSRATQGLAYTFPDGCSVWLSPGEVYNRTGCVQNCDIAKFYDRNPGWRNRSCMAVFADKTTSRTVSCSHSWSSPYTVDCSYYSWDPA